MNLKAHKHAVIEMIKFLLFSCLIIGLIMLFVYLLSFLNRFDLSFFMGYGALLIPFSFFYWMFYIGYDEK